MYVRVKACYSSFNYMYMYLPFVWMRKPLCEWSMSPPHMPITIYNLAQLMRHETDNHPTYWLEIHTTSPEYTGTQVGVMECYKRCMG